MTALPQVAIKWTERLSGLFKKSDREWLFFICCADAETSRGKPFIPLMRSLFSKTTKSCPLFPNKHLSFSVWKIINPACVRASLWGQMWALAWIRPQALLCWDWAASRCLSTSGLTLMTEVWVWLVCVNVYCLMDLCFFDFFLFCKVCMFSIFVLTVITNGCKLSPYEILDQQKSIITFIKVCTMEINTVTSKERTWTEERRKPTIPPKTFKMQSFLSCNHKGPIIYSQLWLTDYHEKITVSIFLCWK